MPVTSEFACGYVRILIMTYFVTSKHCVLIMKIYPNKWALIVFSKNFKDFPILVSRFLSFQRKALDDDRASFLRQQLSLLSPSTRGRLLPTPRRNSIAAPSELSKRDSVNQSAIKNQCTGESESHLERAQRMQQNIRIYSSFCSMFNYL